MHDDMTTELQQVALRSMTEYDTAHARTADFRSVSSMATTRCERLISESCDTSDKHIANPPVLLPLTL